MLNLNRFEKGEIWNQIAKKYNENQLKSVISIGGADYEDKLIDKSQKANLHKQMKLSGIFPNNSTKLLDAGCGSGRFLSFFEERSCKTFGFDFSVEMLKLASKFTNDSQLVCASLQSFPFANNTFDVIISVGTLKLLPDLNSAVKELVRCTKPNGHLVILDSPSDRVKYGYCSPRRPSSSYIAAFEQNGLFLQSQSGVRWPYILRSYRKITKKLLVALFRNKITIEPEGQISFSPQLLKIFETIYHFGLKFASTLNYLLDELFSACHFNRFSYERVFVFQRKI